MTSRAVLLAVLAWDTLALSAACGTGAWLYDCGLRAGGIRALLVVWSVGAIVTVVALLRHARRR